MNKTTISIATLTAAYLAVSSAAHAIDQNYRKKLERSGCTQASELQGCDINKTKEENAKAGFGTTAAPAAAKPAPKFKDLVGKDSISAIDRMTERGFKDVDSLSSGNTQYGIFYHPGSRLCVQLAMANGKVASADDIKTHPKCR